jgi:hypothetical protein
MVPALALLDVEKFEMSFDEDDASEEAQALDQDTATANVLTELKEDQSHTANEEEVVSEPKFTDENRVDSLTTPLTNEKDAGETGVADGAEPAIEPVSAEANAAPHEKRGGRFALLKRPVLFLLNLRRLVSSPSLDAHEKGIETAKSAGPQGASTSHQDRLMLRK